MSSLPHPCVVAAMVMAMVVMEVTIVLDATAMAADAMAMVVVEMAMAADAMATVVKEMAMVVMEMACCPGCPALKQSSHQ